MAVGLRHFRLIPDLNPSRAKAESGAAVRAAWYEIRALTPIDRVLLGCVVFTLLALVADYRLGLAPVRELVHITPFVENGGRELAFEQLIGWHALVWLMGSALVLLYPGYRRGMVSLPAALLLVVAVAIPAITAVNARVDSLTLESFFGVGLPLAAMVALALHPGVSEKALRAAVWIVAGSAGALTLATLAREVLNNSLDRLGILFFGPTTSTGPVLAALAVLVLMLLPTGRRSRAAAIVLFVVLVAGLAFTQSRTAAVALLVGVSIAGVSRRNVSKWAFVIGGAFALGLLTLAPRSLFSAAQSTSFKAANIGHHWRLFLEHPSFGYGVSRESLPAAGGADNTLLAMANGIGGYCTAAFVLSWCVALGGVSRRWMAVGGAVLAVYATGWFGGGEILFQIPVTNLLPLALACGLSRQGSRCQVHSPDGTGRSDRVAISDAMGVSGERTPSLPAQSS